MELAQFRELAGYIVTALLLGCAITTKLITKVIGHRLLSQSINKVFKRLLLVVALRFIASFVDNYFHFRLPYFSTAVGIGLFVYLFFVLLQFYMTLKKREDEIHKTEGSILYVPPLDKQKIQNLIDGLFHELSANKRKTTDLQKDIESTLKKL